MERLSEGVLRFQRFPVAKARVVAYNAPTQYGSEKFERGSAPAGMLNVWSKQVEAKLLETWKGEDEEGEMDEEMDVDEW